MKPFSTESLTTPRTIASSLPASSGQRSSRSPSFPKRQNSSPSTTPNDARHSLSSTTAPCCVVVLSRRRRICGCFGLDRGAILELAEKLDRPSPECALRLSHPRHLRPFILLAHGPACRFPRCCRMRPFLPSYSRLAATSLHHERAHAGPPPRQTRSRQQAHQRVLRTALCGLGSGQHRLPLAAQAPGQGEK